MGRIHCSPILTPDLSLVVRGLMQACAGPAFPIPWAGGGVQGPVFLTGTTHAAARGPHCGFAGGFKVFAKGRTPGRPGPTADRHTHPRAQALLGQSLLRGSFTSVFSTRVLTLTTRHLSRRERANSILKGLESTLDKLNLG